MRLIRRGDAGNLQAGPHWRSIRCRARLAEISLFAGRDVKVVWNIVRELEARRRSNHTGSVDLQRDMRALRGGIGLELLHHLLRLRGKTGEIQIPYIRPLKEGLDR